MFPPDGGEEIAISELEHFTIPDTSRKQISHSSKSEQKEVTRSENIPPSEAGSIGSDTKEPVKVQIDTNGMKCVEGSIQISLNGGY